MLTNLRTSSQSLGIFGLRPESDSAGIGWEEVSFQNSLLLVALHGCPQCQYRSTCIAFICKRYLVKYYIELVIP